MYRSGASFSMRVEGQWLVRLIEKGKKINMYFQGTLWVVSSLRQSFSIVLKIMYMQFHLMGFLYSSNVLLRHQEFLN